jgi:hypothetical protein
MTPSTIVWSVAPAESTVRVTVCEPAHLRLILLQHDAVNAIRESHATQ